MSESDSLVELLAQAGIRLKSLWPGHNEHVICPACGGGRTREPSLSVTIDDDGDGATWICHRGKCEAPPGGARVHVGAPKTERPKLVHQKPAPHTQAQTEHRPDWLYEMFAERKIGARTVQELGIYATERSFPHPFGKMPAIVFPYSFNGEVVNRKFRSHPKQTMMQEKDALPTLFNVDRIGDAPAEVVWVEGEMDVAALFECGINAVSLKDGAPKSAAVETDPNAKRFLALQMHADMLAKVPRIVLAGDMDAPGLALREELARRLGRHRCLLVTWPTDCKDAGDVLRLHGPEAVLRALHAARPYPIDGLQRIDDGTLRTQRRAQPPAVMTTGTRATDSMLSLPTEGRLIIVTGWPGSGKTNWTRFVMIHTMRKHGRRWAVFSPEMQPWELFAAECAEVWSGKPFWPVTGFASMTDDEISEAEDWLGSRLTMLVCDAEDQAPTVDWIIEHARIAALRDGITDLLVDPWNEIDHVRALGMTETDYIGRSLQRFKAFGLRHGCNVWVIAHPAKPQPLQNGDKRGHPGAYDISGSSHWFNRADLGLTVHSPSADIAELHTWKARFVRRWGKRGASATMAFNPVTGCYRDLDIGPSDPPPYWQDTDR